MKWEELAFVNQQLAGMLRAGIPLEGGIRQMCAAMRHGRYREEFEALENDLGEGIPLEEAIARRKLPGFYIKMVRAGAKSGDLPGMLTMLGDYYSSVNAVWLRMRALLVYPALVLLLSTCVSLFLCSVAWSAIELFMDDPGGFAGPALQAQSWWYRTMIWAPSIVLLLLSVAALVVLAVPRLRGGLVWRVPGLRDAALARIAATMQLMLRGGCGLADALACVREMEMRTPAGRVLDVWSRRLAEGRGKTTDLLCAGGVFPELFVWLVKSGGEDVATGFGRAQQLFLRRAGHCRDVMLFALLPSSLIAAGGLILGQLIPVVVVLRNMMDSLFWF